MVDNRTLDEPSITPEEAALLCDRNFGVGGDGVIFALKGKNGGDYEMRIYNSDGSEPEMCGNGLRCMAKFLQKLENKDGQETSYDIWTLAGMIKPKITKNGSVEVDMGLAQLESE